MRRLALPMLAARDRRSGDAREATEATMSNDVWGRIIAGILLVAAVGVAFVYNRRKAATVAVEEVAPAPMTRADVYEVMATMAFADLTLNEQTQLYEFIRNE